MFEARTRRGVPSPRPGDRVQSAAGAAGVPARPPVGASSLAASSLTTAAQYTASLAASPVAASTQYTASLAASPVAASTQSSASLAAYAQPASPVASTAVASAVARHANRIRDKRARARRRTRMLRLWWEHPLERCQRVLWHARASSNAVLVSTRMHFSS